MWKMGFIRTLSLLLVMALVAVWLPMGVRAAQDETIPQQREPGEPYAVEGGVILFNKATGTVTGYQGQLYDLVIPQVIDGVTVTRIGPYAFCNGVWRDGSLLFVNRNPLNRVGLPETVTEIAAYAFDGCDFWTIGVPNGFGNFLPIQSLKIIGPYAFNNCFWLSSIHSLMVPALEEVGEWAFANCQALMQNVALPPSLTYLGDGAFSNIGINEAYIQFEDGRWDGNQWYPSHWGVDMFRDCHNLQSVFWDSSRIPSGTFSECENLSEVQFHRIHIIESRAFAGCLALGELNVPSSVSYIAPDAFAASGHAPPDEILPDLIFRVSPDSYAEEYAIEYGIPYVYVTDSIRFTLSVTDENDTVLTDGFTVNWYEQGRPDVVATGNTVYLIGGKSYEYEVVLEEALGSAYKQPGRLPLNVSDGTATLALQKIPSTTLTGRVTDASGQTIPGAAVHITQRPNGQFTVTQAVFTDDNGLFTASVLKAETTVTVSAGGYLNKTLLPVIADDAPETVDVGTVVLQQLANKLITVSMTGREAALPGESGQAYGIYTFEGLIFSLFNVTRNRVMAPVVQYPYLVLDGEPLSPGDEIEITVVDSKGSMTAPPVSVEIDGELNGLADISFSDNGYFTAMAGEGLAMVFDATGAFVSNIIHSGMIKSVPLSQGDYTVVFMDRTPMLTKVLRIEKLAEMGLVSGIDYIAMPVSITNGIITALGDISVPALDVSKLLYTKSALFSVNKQTISMSAFATYRLSYEIDEKHMASGETLTIEFPEGIDLIENSVTLDGPIVPYTYQDRVLTVRTNRSGGVLRFFAAFSESGEQFLSAFLSFQNGGSPVTQPLGQATVTAKEFEINVPEATSREQVNVFGEAPAGQTVTIYDKEVMIGQTVANSFGEWRATVELNRPYAYSYHTIYATSENLAGMPIKSEEKTLIHNVTHQKLSKVVMYNRDQTVIDFANPTGKKPVYIYDPSKPSFTFTAEFDNPDAVESDVSITVTGFDDVKRSVPLAYDANKQVWVGAENFDIYSSPKSIGVSYVSQPSEALYDRRQFQNIKNDIENLLADLDIDREELKADLAAAGISVSVIEDTLEEKENGLFGNYITRMDYLGGTENVSLYQKLSVSAFNGNADQLLNDGYDCVTGTDGGKMYVKISETDAEMLTYVVDAVAGTLTVSGMTTYDPTTAAPRTSRSDSIPIGTIIKVVTTNLFTLAKKYGPVFSAINVVDSTVDAVKLVARRDDLAKWIKKDCCISESVRADCLQQLMWLGMGGVTVGGGSFVTGALGTMFGIVCITEGVALAPALVIGSAFVVVGIGFGLAQAAISSKLDAIELRASSSSMRLEGSCCSTPDCCGFKPEPEEEQEMDRAVDPSGYVYEAVPSNRLAGVTATVYCKPMDAGPDDPGELWDAGDYWQENPLITDTFGQYAWDVPWGQWQVRFVKDGYELAESEWLPVPPPQVDINIGMVSRAAPAVTSVKGYEDYIEVAFDKYMDTGTLTTDSIALMGYSGDYAIAYRDVEQDPRTPGMTFARYVRIIPVDGKFAMGSTVGISIRTVAQSYAGVGLSNDYHTDVTIVAEPKSITGEDQIKLNYGTTRTLQVSVLPLQAGANKMVTAVSTSPYIATVSEWAVTDENGVATFSLTGELSGAADIVFKLEDMQVTKTVAVAVGLPGETAADTFTVTFDPNGGTRTGGGALIQTVPAGGAAVAPIVSRNGYTFNGWDKTYDNVNADITVKAQWTMRSSDRSTTAPPLTVVPETPPTQEWLNPYSDVADTDWFYEAVRFVAGNELMNGTGSNMFSPHAGMTRAMIVTVLYRVEGKPAVIGSVSFPDVKTGEWYSDAILWASQNAIVFGYPNGSFGPDDPITREQAVTILYRYANAKGLDVSAAADLSKFTDAHTISDWALEAMRWAVAAGIIEGRPGNRTAPNETSTRAELAMIFKRYLEDLPGDGEGDQPEE